ncbi:hypothetical protein QWZ13_19610 [Reinekea marina]|uniref:hypothetical protein n=1 Tax=Reinekea marina TaxID=1310421 RepID=UPI0025B5F698|nr:hypothetical protein [Reinekea marina]MDN3647558.1 hypothetical protein [Reinekea marina]MDN3651124.1 hypothetical protein [Reinekea marina]
MAQAIDFKFILFFSLRSWYSHVNLHPCILSQRPCPKIDRLYSYFDDIKNNARQY